MNNQKTTKRSLVAAGLVLLLCIAMLVGTTFAWFTDSASTAVNKIQAGTLDIQLLMHNGSEYVDISNDTRAIFGTDSIAQNNNANTLWEPGKTQVAYLAIKNNGNLALKYKVALDVTNVTKDMYKAMEYVITPDATNVSPVTAWTTGRSVSEGTQYVSDDVSLAAGATHYFALSIHMKESAGNEYQGGEVDFDLTVLATQDTVEADSFNNQYDENAAGDEFRQGVTVSGIAGLTGSYATVEEAYEAGKAIIAEKCGLGQEMLSAEAFIELFTDGGKITWTIYGNQKVTDTRMFSFGRAANRFGEDLHITEINIVGGNNSATLDLSAVNGTFALPYNWWNNGSSINTALKCKNITFNGITSMPSATYQSTSDTTDYEFYGCTFNGNLYSYQNFDVNMTIKNSTFNAPANTAYAFMSQGAGGTIVLDNNTFNNYTRGVNFQRPTADFVFTNNTIKSTCSKSDRGAIQLTDGKSFVVTANKIDVNGGNAFWFHNAATNSNVTYVISNNDIKAPYIGYYNTSFDVNEKITSSDNNFNSTNTTKCMKAGATTAEATNLTAIH